jgi:hypothetical protein
MAFAQGSRHEMAFGTEVTFGVTPGGPTTTLLRNTGTTLGLSKESFTSAEIRADRQIEFSRHGNKQVGGDINFELAYGNVDTLLESLMFSAWVATNGTAAGATTDAAGYAIGATAITLAVAGTGTILDNDTITFAGDTTPYKVAVGDTNVANGGTITLQTPGLLQAIPASATAITVKTSGVLKAGVTQKSLFIERRFTDIAQFMLYNGCVANTMNLPIAAGQPLTGSIGVVGSKLTTSGSQVAAPGAAPTGDPFTAFEGVLLEGGSQIATITALALNLTNGVEANFVVGSDETPQLSVGRSNLTGTITAFFEDLALLNKFINETESSLKVTLTSAAGAVLDLNVPRLKYNGGDNPVSGEQSLQINMPFQALYNAADLSNIVFTRTAA